MRDLAQGQAPLEKKAIIAMSGGVDSSVAALLCQRQGYDCIGVTLALTDNSDRGLPEEAFPGERTCCSVDDVADARSVAFRLGMPFYVFNFKEAFRRQVMDRFAAAYQRGETPNPCIDCNRYIKFAKLMDRGEEIGYPYVATGHYARVEFDETSGRWLLKKGLDQQKDQSYMLYSLTQWELSRLLLPLGGLTKEETRRLAEEQGFVNARKRDSQDICFVPDGDYAAFIRRWTGRISPRRLCGNRRRDLRPAQGYHPLHRGTAEGPGSFLPPAHVRQGAGRGKKPGGAGKGGGAVLPNRGGSGHQPDLRGEHPKAPAGKGEGPLPAAGTACHRFADRPGPADRHL